MIDSLFKALSAAFSLWDDKEKNKYVDQLIQLKTDYYEEFNKDPSNRDDSVLDALELKLRILTDSFSTAVGSKNAPPKP